MSDEYHHYNSKLKNFSREHRNKGTKAEVRLWCELLRGKQLLGFSFLRQRSIGKFIADFYCKELQLVIETDGSPHFDPEVYAMDQAKTAWLESEGYMVLRFLDNEVMNDISGVKARIADWILEHHREKLPE